MESDCEGLEEVNPMFYNKFVDWYFNKYTLSLTPQNERDLLEKEHAISKMEDREMLE